MKDKNESQEIELNTDFDQSEEALKAALLDLITHIAYLCARHDYLDFYAKWLDSLQSTVERESGDGA